MQIEHVYEASISYFKHFKIRKNNRPKIVFFKIFQENFRIIRNETHLQEHLLMNMCAQFQVAFLKKND